MQKAVLKFLVENKLRERQSYHTQISKRRLYITRKQILGTIKWGEEKKIYVFFCQRKLNVFGLAYCMLRSVAGTR